jgi:non-canonical (house-cleaning) NTP pyrophosphatase
MTGRFGFWTALLLILVAGCAPRGIRELPLEKADVEKLRQVETQMLQGYSPEVEIDRRISEAVRQMVSTLRPEYKGARRGKYRLGFLEISDINRRTVTRFHHYVTEKALAFTYLQEDIARNFNIVEQFLLQDVFRETGIRDPRDPWAADAHLARHLGRLYDIDIIETGVATDGEDFVDINLRMIETRGGRVVAVGSAKIEITPMIREWLRERMPAPRNRFENWEWR